MLNDTRQTASDRAFSGDVIVSSDGGNVTERAVAFLIPPDAFKKARNSNPDFNSQVSVLLYKNTFFFPSSFNVSQVGCNKFLDRFRNLIRGQKSFVSFNW